jgi:two-component system invasion response regulator UvrY
VGRSLRIAVVAGDDGTHTPPGESLKGLSWCWTWQSLAGDSDPGPVCSANPDVVLMDIQMPDSAGLSSARKLKAVLPAVPIIVLAASLDLSDVLQFLVAGASGFLLNPITPEALARAVRDVLKEDVVLCPKVQAALLGHLHHQSLDNKFESLSWQELKVGHLLVGRLSTQEIAAKLGVSSITIHSHRMRIYRKLGVHSREEARRRFSGLGQAEP